MAKLLPTTLVGSCPQPDWLIDRARLSKMVPRVRMSDLWSPIIDLLSINRVSLDDRLKFGHLDIIRKNL